MRVSARGLACLLRAGLLVGLAISAGQAAAQDTPRPRPKLVAPPPDPAASAANSLSDQNSVGAPDSGVRPPASAKAGPTLRPLIPGPPPLILRSAVHSRYSRQATIARSTAPQCRARCAEARTQCASGETETGGCDPAWTQCLSTCDGLSYSRAP